MPCIAQHFVRIVPVGPCYRVHTTPAFGRLLHLAAHPRLLAVPTHIRLPGCLWFMTPRTPRAFAPLPVAQRPALPLHTGTPL